MSDMNSTANMAVFCDFENVALGVRDANYKRFDIQQVLERLLLKGNIVVKKAYCDWDRYKGFKSTMHEAAFELIEIPHVRMSGKNSADIRMVVDALDLCYTKAHVDVFVVISGDSDFSPLVAKLRENNKLVIGVGVKNSTSDLLIASCDEFIYYDDLIRAADKRKPRAKKSGSKKKTRSSKAAAKETEAETEVDRTQEAFDLLLETLDDMMAERGDKKVWGSMVKQAIKRRKPGFNESYHGFKGFSQLLEEAQKKGLITMQNDAESGGHIITAVNADD
ncbi:MAG: NYN domain-containing protein [Pseudomonadota bacterium]